MPTTPAHKTGKAHTMAKLIAPLMSLEARGSCSPVVTFNQTGNRSTAKKKHKPGGTPSAAQLSRRETYTAAAEVWATLTPAEKASYNKAALPYRISGYNLFISDWLKQYGPTGQTIWDSGATEWDNGLTTWY